MLGLNYTSVGSNMVADFAGLTSEKRFLMSLSWGILMCKLIKCQVLFFDIFLLKSYEFTGIVTSFFFKGFIKLNKAQKLEWKNRGFSTFHALFVACASVYFLLISDLFYANDHVQLIKRRSILSDTILGVSSGYFLSDITMIIWTYPALGGLEYILHHGISMFAILQCILCGEAQYYIFMVLFTEITTPFVNLRWYFDVAGMKSSKLYLWNGIAMFFGWLIARIMLFGFLFYHLYNHIDQARHVHTITYYGLYMVPPVLSIMNLFWFYKIAKGMIRTIRKKNKTRTS